MKKVIKYVVIAAVILILGGYFLLMVTNSDSCERSRDPLSYDTPAGERGKP